MNKTAAGSFGVGNTAGILSKDIQTTKDSTLKLPIEFKRSHQAGNIRESMETKRNHDALISRRPNLTSEEREKLNRSVVIMG